MIGLNNLGVTSPPDLPAGRQVEAKALERIRFHDRAKQLRSY
jgi:hypothetical protein